MENEEPRTSNRFASRDTTSTEEVYIEVNSGQPLTLGEIVSDRLTKEIGSWRFIGMYFVLLILWMIANTIAWVHHWDPYPFIFLNLVLSFQGAFAAPIILMSQNRQEARDRLEEQYDHAINLRAEREIAAVQARMGSWDVPIWWRWPRCRRHSGS
jgi:uncharacterized membrane protein